MKIKTAIFLLAIILTGCAPAIKPAPTVDSPTFTPTATSNFAIPTPSLIPTQDSVPVLTPDAIQVERWREYQTELAKVLLRGYSPNPEKSALCEWDILGRSGQEFYLWALCNTPEGGSGRSPAIIYMELDGSVKNVSVNNDLIRQTFPADALEKIHLYYTPSYPYEGRPEVFRLHLLYRREHPNEPPLVVLLATPTVTPTP